jgi:hypothetical protein
LRSAWLSADARYAKLGRRRAEAAVPGDRQKGREVGRVDPHC